MMLPRLFHMLIFVNTSSDDYMEFCIDFMVIFETIFKKTLFNTLFALVILISGNKYQVTLTGFLFLVIYVNNLHLSRQTNVLFLLAVATLIWFSATYAIFF